MQDAAISLKSRTYLSLSHRGLQKVSLQKGMVFSLYSRKDFSLDGTKMGLALVCNSRDKKLRTPKEVFNSKSK